LLEISTRFRALFVGEVVSIIRRSVVSDRTSVEVRFSS
jgi:hypothetical protein